MEYRRGHATRGADMPIVIWGERGLTSKLDSGRFYCPQCEAEREYALNRVRPWFTLYWIPIFPMGGGTRFVECRRCRGKFAEEVLDREPPSEGEREMARLFRQMERGASVEEVEEELRDMGVEAEKAREWADNL